MRVKGSQTSIDLGYKEKAVWAYEGGNPRAQAFKQLEMSIKRAYLLNSGLIDSLATAGSVAELKRQRQWVILSNKDLKDVLNLSAYGKEDPAIHHQDVWEWMVDHWYTGGLKRSVVKMMDNITKENRMAIKKKVDELYE
jgi:hypothetical protein